MAVGELVPICLRVDSDGVHRPHSVRHHDLQRRAARRVVRAREDGGGHGVELHELDACHKRSPICLVDQDAADEHVLDKDDLQPLRIAR